MGRGSRRFVKHCDFWEPEPREDCLAFFRSCWDRDESCYSCGEILKSEQNRWWLGASAGWSCHLCEQCFEKHVVLEED